MEEQTQPMRDAARGALDGAKREATERADAAMGTILEESKALANALRGAADQAERDGARMVHGPLRSVAAMFERWADKTASDGTRHVFSSLEAFGRREPLAFFGAATAVGFLGARALRAGAQAASSAAPSARPDDRPRANMTMSSEQRSTGSPPPDDTLLDMAPARLGMGDGSSLDAEQDFTAGATPRKETR